MHESRFPTLFQKYLDNTLSKDELSDFQGLLQDPNMDEELRQQIQLVISEDDEVMMEDGEAWLADIGHRVAMQVQEEKPVRRPSPIYRFRKLIAAASIVLICGIGYWQYDRRVEKVSNSVTQQDILPGGNKAQLTLSNGQKIDLSAQQEGIHLGENITYADGSKVDGLESSDIQDENQSLLTLSTPKGGQYQITLPDGSRVWLNAASSLRYPMRFASDKREVYLEGEAYFEVKKLPKGDKMGNTPFIVRSAGHRIDVVGTGFNVSAYPDEKRTQTTLVEGMVLVGPEQGPGLLIDPGQQTTLTEGKWRVAEVNTEDFTAWKDGTFVFNNATLEEVFREVARWYDIEVAYSSPTLKRIHFEGVLPRFEKLSALLGLLEKVEDVSFEIDGRKVFVRKKTKM